MPTTCHTLGLVVQMEQGAVLFGNSVYFYWVYYDNGKKGLANTTVITNVEVVHLRNDTCVCHYAHISDNYETLN